MKKLILAGMLVFGIMGFAKDRFVERCEITSKGVYKNGKNYINCISKATGRHFNFVNVYGMAYETMHKGRDYFIRFEGEGYRNLFMIEHDYLN